jgi:hypothetical protein
MNSFTARKLDTVERLYHYYSTNQIIVFQEDIITNNYIDDGSSRTRTNQCYTLMGENDNEIISITIDLIENDN